jgi:hypothetical protein
VRRRAQAVRLESLAAHRLQHAEGLFV